MIKAKNHVMLSSNSLFYAWTANMLHAVISFSILWQGVPSAVQKHLVIFLVNCVHKSGVLCITNHFAEFWLQTKMLATDIQYHSKEFICC
jgi:hypothetical protein